MVESVEDGLEKVNQGDVFGLCRDTCSPALDTKFQTKFNGELKIAGKFDEYWELGIGVRDDDPILN